MLHFSLLIMVIGAIITHFFGIQGTLMLEKDKGGSSVFKVVSGPSNGQLPFSVCLKESNVIFFRGTVTPKDFQSVISIKSKNIESVEKTISMNKVAEYRGWRFYQNGMGNDTSTLSVAYDPWGIGVTYTGYTFLFLSMILFFFQKRTVWRCWVRKIASITTIMMFFCCHAEASNKELPALQKPLAANFCKMYVYWNDRIVPMQTMAKDVTVALYGSANYKGFTPEQVLTGWLFHYDDWERDFNTYKPDISSLSDKKKKRLFEKQDLIKMLGTGEIFRIYPYHAATGRMEWLSLSGSRPSKMDTDQWKFILYSMEDIAADIAIGKNVRANEKIQLLIEGQKKYAGTENLPSDAKIRAELIYNEFFKPIPCMILLLLTGFFSILFCDRDKICRSIHLDIIITVIALMSSIFIISADLLTGYIANKFPLSNGFETMLCTAALSSLAALCLPSGLRLIRSGLIFVAGFAMAVAIMSESHPRIDSLTPVLDSPLLSIHVMLVALSYGLFFLMAVIAAKGLFSKGGSYEADLNHVFLIPALFLLTAGIFTGAIWANQSWGRYWGWDPKETCALITMLIYSLPVHTRTFKIFLRPKIFNYYILLALLPIIFTYFGANYLLTGLHSYA